MIKLKERRPNKPKYISTLIPLLISVLCIQIHAHDGNNFTYSQQSQPQNFHLKENLKLDQETDKNYKSFISLDSKEQNIILQSFKAQGLGSSFDSKLISKWSFLKNIIDFDTASKKYANASQQTQNLNINQDKLVKSLNSSMIQKESPKQQIMQNFTQKQNISKYSQEKLSVTKEQTAQNISLQSLQKIGKNSFKTISSSQSVSQTPSIKDIFEMIASKNQIALPNKTDEKDKRFFWNPSVTVYNGDNRRFVRDEKFTIIEFLPNQNEQKSLIKVVKSFSTTLLKDAFDQFRKHITGDILVTPTKQYALIGNRRLLLTTSAFDIFFTNSNELADKDGKEYKSDFISKMIIGFGIQKNLLKWPQGSIDEDYDGFQILTINKKKKGKWQNVGTDLKKAEEKFKLLQKKDKTYILTHSNGKIFKTNGQKYEQDMHWDTYIALAGYLQKNFQEYNSILRNERDAGFVMQWQIEDKRAAQVKLLREWYKGNGEELQKSYTIFAVIYNIESQTFQTKNILKYTYMQKGIEDLINIIDKTILQTDSGQAYLFTVKEGNPIYCSDGHISQSQICQQMLGYALFSGKQLPDTKFTDLNTPQNSKDSHYFALLQEESGKIIRKEFSQDFNAAVKKYNQIIHKKNSKIVTGVISHTSKYLFNNQFTQYTAKNPIDVYSLITKYCQSKLKLYLSESHDEKSANLITKKDFLEQQKQQHDKLFQIYTGKGLKLQKPYNFELVTYDRRTNKIDLLKTVSSQNMSQVFELFAKTVYEQIIIKQQNKAFLYLVKESAPLYCSEGSLENVICKRMIGNSIIKQWLSQSQLTDSSLTPDSPDYSFIAYYMNSNNKNQVQRVKLGSTKDKKLIADYNAKLKAGKFNIGVLSHSSLPSQYQEMITSYQDLLKFQDVFEMIATYAQNNLKTFKQTLTDEFAANLVTELQVQQENALKIEQLKSIYTGSNGDLYKKFNVFALSYDKKTSKINKIFSNSFINLKTGINEASKQIEKQIINQNKNMVYLILSENYPIYCSEKNDLSNKYCQRMIGNAIYNKYLRLDNQLNLKSKIVDTWLNHEDKQFEFVAYVWNTYKKQLKVKKVGLGKNKQKAIIKFQGLFGKKSEYTIGVISHTQKQKFLQGKSQLKGEKQNRDIYQMLAVYCQQKGIFKNSASNEKDGYLKTKDEWELYLKQQNETLSKLYKGNNEKLNKKYTFNVITYHRRSNKIQLLFQQQFSDMKTAITQMTNQVLLKVFGNEQDQAYLFGVKESNQFYCSEGDLKKPICQRMIGRSIRNDFITPSKKLVNPFIIPSSIDYKYLAYLQDSKGKIIKKDLNADWQKSRKLFTQLVDPKSSYKVGVIGHTSLNVWLAPHSQRKGTLKDSDIDEMIAQYCQQNLKIYAQGDITEKGAQVLTKSHAYEIQKQLAKRLEILTKGNHNSLYKTYQFVVITYDLNTNEVKKLTQSGHKNFKAGLNQIIQSIQTQIIIPMKELAFTIQIKETVPFYCSEGEFTDVICQRMIGYSILKAFQRAPKQLIDQQISSKDENYQYFCIVQDSRIKGNLPRKYNLSNDFKQAQKWYNELFNKSEDVSFTVGIMGHTQKQEFWNPKTSLTGSLVYQDVNQMITTYIQTSLKRFLKSGTSYEITKLKTKRQWVDQITKADNKLSQIFKGVGFKLYKSYQFFAAVYNKKTHQISNIYVGKHRNMNQAIKKMNQAVYDYIIRAERSHAYLYGVKETVPFYCSEGDLKNPICQRIIGHSIKNKWFNLNRKLVDVNIPKDSKHWNYIAYLRVNKKSQDVKRIKLSKDFQESLKKYKSLTEGAKGKYKIGLLTHSAQRIWLNPVSQQKGIYFEKDVYEMIVSYCQQKKKLYLKSGADESTAKLVSRKEMDKKMKEKLKKLYTFYQGSNEKLQKQITMGVMTYDKYTHKIEQLKWQSYDNMKKGFDDSIEALYKFVLKTYKNKAFVIYIHETSPLYCSEGKDMQNKLCQRMIGHALRKGWLKPNVKMVDSNISEQDDAFQYVAYLQSVKSKTKKQQASIGEVVRINLSADFQVAQDKFMEQLESKKYNIGIIGHTQINDYWNIQTIQDGLLREKDIDRMLALYCQQKLKIYVNNINDEKKANLKLQKDWKLHLEKEQTKLKSLFKGNDDVLSIKYMFFVLAYHRRSHQYSVIYWRKHQSMKNAMLKMSDSVMKNIVELEEDKAYLFGVRETSPFYCSEGSLDKPICRRMIGHAIKTNLIYTNKKLIDRNLDASDNGYNYVAYLRNEETKKVTRINLDSDLKSSQKKFEKLFSSEDSDYSTGIIGHTGINKWWSPHVQKTGIPGVNDLYELIAEYCQQSLHIYDKTTLNEKDLSLLSKKQIDKNIQKENNKIKQIYKGKGEKLYKSYIFFAMTYDKQSRVINYLSWQGFYSLKNAMSQISAQIIENVINQKRDVAFTLQSRDTVPFYCSEGDLSKPLCRRMIGYSVWKGWQRAPQKMIDRKTPTVDEQFQYAAYVQNTLGKDKKVLRVLLGKDYSKAQQKFKSLFAKKQYNVGAIGHTALPTWSQPVSIKIGKRLNHDVYEMIAQYIQENLKSFSKSGIDEKTALLKYDSEWQSYLKVQRQNLKKLFKGTGENLHKAYDFIGISYNKRTNEIEIMHSQKEKSMRNAIKGLNNAVYRKVILAEEDKAYLYATKQSVPFYCSEGDLNKQLCQTMIGYLIYNLKININRKISDKYIHETEAKYSYFAYLRNKKTKAVEKVLLQKDLAKSKLQFKKLTQIKGKYNVGVIGHTSLGKWFSPLSELKGSKKLTDVYQIIAKYCQDSLNLYKVSGLDENKAELITEQFIKEKRKRAKKFLTSLFVGSGAQLKEPVTLSAITYNRNTHQLSIIGQKSYQSMKIGMAELTYTIYKKVVVPNDDVSFLIISKQSNPLYCSQGQMTDKICKRMIGYALYKNYLNANVKIVDTHTPADSDESKYVAYLLNTKSKNAKIKRHELSSNLKASIDIFNKLLKKSYSIGIICHSGKQEWQAATSKNLGPYRMLDVYELLASYSQNNLKIYLQNGDRGVNEQFAQLTFKKDWEEHLKQQKIKLMSLYRGNSQDTLYKPYTFFLAIYHTRSHYIKQIYQGKHINMKEAMLLMAEKALDQVIYPNNDFNFMFFVKETVPLWCQSGNLRDQKFCKRMIGYALKQKWLNPSKKLVDLSIQQDDSRYQYVAYVLNKVNNRVEKISLDKDFKKSSQQYEKLFSGDKKKQKYTAGIIGHSAINQYWNPKSNKKNVKKTEIIISELLARYCQESLNLYTNNALNENDANLKLQRNMANNYKQIEGRLNSLYRGNHEELYKPYTFAAIQYDKDSDKISLIKQEQFVNMKTAAEVLVKQVYSNIVKENKNYAYMYLVKETVPLYCSEGNLNNIYCQRMIGLALKEGWINADDKFVNPNIQKIDAKYQFVAYLQNKLQKNSKVVKKLLGKDLAKAKSQFQKLIQGNKYQIGILGYTYQQKWESIVSKFTGSLLNQDVYQMIAQYNQQNLGIWNDNNAIQNEQKAKLILKKDFNNQIKQQLKSKKSLYKGTAETLVTPLTFSIITYDRNTQKMNLAYSKKQNSMKRAMDEMAEYVVKNIHKPQKKMAYIYLVKEKSPIYCSEGQLTNSLCMRMIGYSVQKSWVAPPKEIVNKDLTSAKQSTYVAYLKEKDTGKIVRKTLSSNKEQAVKIYKSLFVDKQAKQNVDNKKTKKTKKNKKSKANKKQQKQVANKKQQSQGPKYEAGIIGHTKQNVWINPVSAKKGSKKNRDVDELVAGYIQQTLKKYTKTKTSEKDLNVVTKKQLLVKQQEASRKIEQTFKGKGDHLFKKYTFYAVYYDKQSNKMFLPKSHQFGNMKVAMDALSVQVIDQIVKPQKDRAYIFFVKETVPIYCSEGSLSNNLCRRMIGYAIMNHLQTSPSKFISKHIQKKDVKYQYVAYLKNINQKNSQVEKLLLGSDFKNAIKQFNGRIKVINKNQRLIGVIGHTQMNGFWHPVTALKSNLKFYDVYELLSEYLQQKLNIFKDFALDERAAQLKTKRDENKRLKSQRKLLRQLYKGKDEKLAKHYMFLALGYHKKSNVISKIYQSQHQSMKTALNRITEAVYKQIVKPDRNIAYLFAVREGSPFYCSEGDLSQKICQRMIGFALRYNLIFPPVQIVNKKLQRDSPDYKFVSYMQTESNKVEKVDLSTDKKQSIAQFNKLIESGKYTAGILSHTAYNFWYAKSSDREGSLKDHDLYRILAKYIQQKLGKFKNSGVNEQVANIQTATQKVELIKKNHETLMKPFKDLTGKEEFFQPYNLRIVIYYYNKQPIQNILIGEYTNLKSGIKDAVEFIQTIVTKDQLNSKFEVLYYLEEGSPFYCSAGQIDSKVCQIMLGEAIVDQKFQTNGVLGKSGLIDAYACANNFYAIIQDNKKHISKIQIKQASWDKAVSEFKKLTNQAGTIGILYQNSYFGDFKSKHVLVKSKFSKGNKQNEDVYLMVAKFFINSEIYTKFAVDGAGILVEQRKAQLAEVKKDYNKKLQKVDKFAKELLKKYKGNNSKFVKQFSFTVFSWRNSSNTQNIIKWKPLKANNIQDFLRLSSQRILELNDASKKVHLEPYNIPRTLQGQREFIKQKNIGEFEHVVLLSSGRKPKLMMTSHGVNTTGAQYMIGFAYSQLNNNKIKWWKSGFQNAVKNQLFKISDKYRALSNSSLGLQRAFYVVSNKETGQDKVKVCNISNSESRKETRKGIQDCAADFLSSINDTSKEDGFLMDQYLPIMGSPSSLLAQQNQTIKQTFSGYLSFGKWIVKNLPEDFKENQFSENDIEIPLEGVFESKKRRYYASSFTRQVGGKNVYPRFKYHQSNSLGQFEKFLIDQSLQSNSIHPNFWKDYETKDNFKKPTKTSGLIIAKGKDNQYYPIATNKKEVSIKDHDSLISIGLFMKQYSNSQSLNLLKNCSNQAQYHGNWTYLIWDQNKKQTVRQVCSQCQAEFDSYLQTIKQNNNALTDYQVQKIAMKNFGKERFSKIYYETMNQQFPDGVSLFSKEGNYIYSALGRGYDSNGVSKENEVFFTLGKYAQDNCKNWQKVYNLQEIGIKPVS